ncbi:hypothetical protein FB566_3288 [Stackebrandtia endophytica]|uniref:Uncharacterized protein n=1 Tax=Stackebrandtia endophytica TaxID=1496996 RepID=A0A543AYS7_9ACTN|nr:hypothetical protein [Stackebrandtia endophytica]TQL77724.1 hypothetical protein FB566_3288 [Stackebrandtia endophytica]
MTDNRDGTSGTWLRALMVAIIGIAFVATMATPAAAETVDTDGSSIGIASLAGDCTATALTDRRDRSTDTFGSGRISCKHDNYFQIIIEAKLYKGSTLMKVHRATCSGPPVKACAVSTPMVSGSSGTWKTVVTAWADIGKDFKYTATHSKTW